MTRGDIRLDRRTDTPGGLRRPLLMALLVLAQTLVLCAGMSVAATRTLTAPLAKDGPYVLLILGADQGPPRSGSVLSARADGFHILTVSPDRDRVSILSFPRDSYVSVPGIGRTKINASLTRGPETAVATAEQLTGLQIDDWIVTGFHGLMRAVDELGGVTIDVEERLYDPGGSSSDLQPGEQRLVGWQALAYTRDRKSRSQGDFGRAESHARLMQAVHAQLQAEAPDARRLTDLIDIFRRNTVTSLSTQQLFTLARLAAEIPPENVTRLRLGGSVGTTSGGASIVRLAPGTSAVFADVADDGVLDSVQP